MKRILYIAALFSILGLQSPMAQAQQPDAVYKLVRHEWTVNADGTSDYHYRHEVQILRNRALTAYADKGETFIVYNPDLEEVTINEVYTLQLDGTRVDMPQNAFIYQLPAECADCGRFNHLRELALVHTGMELGCTVVVDYTIHRRFNLLHENLPLQRECPIEKLEVNVVNHDEDLDIRYSDISTLKHSLADNKTHDAKGKSTITRNYTLLNVPQAPREPYMPADIIPTLRFYNGVPEHTPAFDQKPFDGASDAMAQQIKSNDPRENVVAMRNFAVDNLHLNDIHPSHLGYVHSTPAETWASGCGTATDKAVFLAASLNQMGYNARVIGEEYDHVGVMIDTVEYSLDVRSKSPLEVNGEAKDEVASCDINQTFDAPDSLRLDSVDEGFYRMAVFAEPLPGEPAIKATQLPLQRTTPMAGTACDLRSTTTYTLPKGLKMVGSAINEELDFPGIGSLTITVKQSGKKLKVVRNLKLEKSRVSVEEYGRYRQLLATWQSTQTKSILFRKK